MSEQGRSASDRMIRFTRRLFVRNGPEPRDHNAVGQPSNQDSHEPSATDDGPSPSSDITDGQAQSSDEYGVRQRVPPPGVHVDAGESFDVDIVAVHGLGGHALKTWTSKNGKMWLMDKDFLPHDLPTARILTFGYNANNFANEVSSKVMDHADALLAGLLTQRMGNEHRPIIFIAHSLGGLVVKEALTTNRPEYRSIVRSTSSIVFLGTPHHGADLAGYLGIAKNLVAWAQLEKSPRSKIHVELKPFSDTIRSINSRFTNPANRYLMRSFAEQKPMHLPPPFGAQLIVPQGSALLGHPNELPVPVYANHTTICKYENPQDDTYFSVSQHLKFLKDMATRRAAEIDVENDELVRRFNALVVPTETYAARTCRYFEVPYSSTPEVFGTQSILDNIKNHFKGDSPAVLNAPRCLVLYGMGGVGKSTVAHTYATIFQNSYEGVFWTSARATGGLAGLDAVKLDFLKWAKHLDKPFLEWANNADRRWLLVIDNFDNLSGVSVQLFREIMPKGIKGHIIVTSRRLRSTMFSTLSLRVEPLQITDAVPMLLAFSFNRAKTSRDDAIAHDVVSRLGRLPLAIRLCAAYANKLQLKLADYPERVQTLLATIDTSLDDQDSDALGEDDVGYNTLFAAGELSIRQLLQSSPLAVDILTIMSYLDASDIAEAVLSRGFRDVGRWDETGDWTHTNIPAFQSVSLQTVLQSDRPRLELSRALATLVDYSLIQRTSENGNYCLHPVTQYWVKQRLSQNSTHMLSDALRIVEHGFPEPDPLRFYSIIDACSHPYLWDYKLHVRALLTSFASRRSSPSHEDFIASLKLSIKAYHVYVANVRGDEGVWLNRSLLQALFTRGDAPIDLWFQALVEMIDELRQDFRFPLDLFQDLSDLTFAGRTWREQRERIQDREDDLSRTLKSVTIAADQQTHETTPSEGEFTADTPKLQDQVPLAPATREAEEALAAMAAVEAEGVRVIGIKSTPAMFNAIDPILTREGTVIPKISIQVVRFVCGFVWSWQSYRNKPELHDTGVVLDTRDGAEHLGFVLKRYFAALDGRELSDHEAYYIARVLRLMSQTQYAEENPDEKRTYLNAAVNLYSRSVGLIFDNATMAVQELVLMDVERKDVAAVEARIRNFTSMGLDVHNFPLHRSLTIYHGDVLKLNRMPLRRIEVYESKLTQFHQTPLRLREYWEFYNDPILDMHEELIFCYANTPNKEDELARCVQDYIEYAGRTYPPPPFPDPYGGWTYRNFLGFGLGSQMLGHPVGRQRIHIEYGQDSPKRIVFILDNMKRAIDPLEDVNDGEDNDLCNTN